MTWLNQQVQVQVCMESQGFFLECRSMNRYDKSASRLTLFINIASLFMCFTEGLMLDNNNC